MYVIEARPDGKPSRIGIVVSRFNEFVTQPLLEGALRGLAEAGVDTSGIFVVWVPGAFEIPVMARTLITELECDAVLGLGAVIRGETAHFDYVCLGTTQGHLQVALETGKPVVFGVLTVDETAQAEARAGSGKDNKGYESALCAVEMIHLQRCVKQTGVALRQKESTR